MQQQWLNQKALTTRFTLFDGASPAQVTAMTPHTGALFRRSQRGRQRYSAVTSMVPTMLAFRAGRSPAGIQYSRMVLPPAWWTS